MGLGMRNNIRDASLALAPNAVLSVDMFKHLSDDIIRVWEKQP